MGLKRATIVKAVKSAFSALGNIPESCVYRRTSSSYDTSTGTNTITNTNYTITAVFTSYSSLEVDRVVVTAADVKMILQQSSLSITPNIATDKVVRGSQTYNVLRISQDPAAATWTLQLRAP